MQLEREVFDFPTAIPLKVIGHNENNFEGFVLELFQKQLAEEEILAVAQRPSREGNYLSVTVTFTAQSREHLDAIYAELNGQPRILMVI